MLLYERRSKRRNKRRRIRRFGVHFESIVDGTRNGNIDGGYIASCTDARHKSKDVRRL